MESIVCKLSNKIRLLDESVEDFNTAIKLNPNYSEAYFNRGKARSAIIKAKKALEFYKNILDNYDEEKKIND